MKKILLVGNPNVGKSVFFSRLTGIHVTASNYPGTTVEYSTGYMKFEDEKAEIIDIPGIYSLDPTCKAEEVAVSMIDSADIIINVIDATNLERSLNLTLQLIEKGLPIIIVLNMWDETSHKGIKIDIKKLEDLLEIPITSTIAVTGQGIKATVDNLLKAKQKKQITGNENTRWRQIGQILANVQTLCPHKHTIKEHLEDIVITPIGGTVIAFLIIFFSFSFIRLIGEALITYIFDPVFQNYYAPLLLKLSSIINENVFLHNILIGKLIQGEIDFNQSFGILSTGLYVPFAAVLPYIIAFYLILGILEDTGYLPRLAILADRLMHYMGLHGYAIIPNLLSLGCNVPGILATRTLESTRERFIAITLISIGVPCAALQAMIIGVLGKYGISYIFITYLIIFFTWLITGLILNFTVKGFSPELILEMPPLRIPPINIFFKKFWMRTKSFLKEAVPIVLIGIFIINIIYWLGFFNWIANLTAPIVEKIWGLPKEAVLAISVGFLRKDIAIGLLSQLDLTIQQLIVGCVVLSMTFPCIASFVMIAKELGIRLLIVATIIMIIMTISIGGLSNFVLSYFL